MQLNPLSIEPVTAALAIAQKRGRYEEVADLVEEAVERQPENPDVVAARIRRAAASWTTRRRGSRASAGCSSSTRTRPDPVRLRRGRRGGPVGQRHRNAARGRGRSRRPRRPIGPPAPDARPLIGPRRGRRVGGRRRPWSRRALAKRRQSPLQPVPERDVRLPAELALRARGVDRDVLHLAQRAAARTRPRSRRCRRSRAAPRRGRAPMSARPSPMLNAPVACDSAAARFAAHDVADVHVVARLLAVAEDRRAARPRAACRRRSRSRRPRRAGPGAGRRRCRSAARRSRGRAARGTGRSSPRRRTSTARRAPRAPAGWSSGAGRIRPSP